MFKELETKRLLIRRFSLEDWEAIHAYSTDPVEKKHDIQDKEVSKELAIEFSKSPYYWAIYVKSSNSVVGHILLTENFSLVWSIGCVLNQKFLKQKYSKEAYIAIINYLFIEKKHTELNLSVIMGTLML